MAKKKGSRRLTTTKDRFLAHRRDAYMKILFSLSNMEHTREKRSELRGRKSEIYLNPWEIFHPRFSFFSCLLSSLPLPSYSFLPSFFGSFFALELPRQNGMKNILKFLSSSSLSYAVPWQLYTHVVCA